METCRFLKDLGATSFFFIRTSETPRWNSNNWVKETLDPKEYFDLAFEVAEADIKEKWKIEEYVFNGFFLTHDGELLKSNRDEDDMGFKPGADFKPSGKKTSILPLIRKRLAGSRSVLAYAVLAGLLLIVPGLIIPAFSRFFIDNVIVSSM